MSLLFRGRDESRAVQLPSWVQDAQASRFISTAALDVTEQVALSHDAYWACVTRISQDVGMMPVDMVRYERGRHVPVDVQPQIIAAPSVWVPSMDWRVQIVASWLTKGTAWGIVTATTPDMSLPTRIELLQPSSVAVTSDGNGVVVLVDGKPEDLWPVGRLWFRPGYTLPGQPFGVSVLQYHAATIGRGLTAGKFGLDYFTDGAHPTGIFTTETDPGEAGAKSLKEKLIGVMRGNRDPLILPKSITYEQIQTNPEDSQFIETMQYSVEQICRAFGEDPADYGSSASGTAMTYANRTDAELARFKRRQYWVTKLQDTLTDLSPGGLKARLNTSAALMMTARERHELHGIRLAQKTTTVNEVRTIEDEDPFGPEFDTPGIPAVSPQPPQGGAV